MLFINTRPAERAEALSRYLRSADYHVIDLPVLALRENPLDQVLRGLYLKLVTAQVIVVVSPTAVDIGMRYLTQMGVRIEQLKHIQWIAVGKTTAELLKTYGIQSTVPEVETSEGILSLPLFESFPNLHSIAFWRGEGGRQFMMQQCQKRGIEILNFVLYRRYCPETSIAQLPEVLSALKGSDVPYYVCISSEASWKNWLHLFADHVDVIQSCHYLVLGQRLYQVLISDKQKLNFAYSVSELNQLKPDVVLQKLEHLKRNV